MIGSWVQIVLFAFTWNISYFRGLQSFVLRYLSNFHEVMSYKAISTILTLIQVIQLDYNGISCSLTSH